MHRRTVQKVLNDSDNPSGMVTHLGPNILECEVKSALKSITTKKKKKACGSDGVQS